MHSAIGEGDQGSPHMGGLKFSELSNFKNAAAGTVFSSVT